MSEKNRTILIVVLVVGALVLLFTNPAPLYSMLGIINSIASTIFFVVATIWIVRKL